MGVVQGRKDTKAGESPAKSTFFWSVLQLLREYVSAAAAGATQVEFQFLKLRMRKYADDSTLTTNKLVVEDTTTAPGSVQIMLSGLEMSGAGRQ